jgi:hypothetical protein
MLNYKQCKLAAIMINPIAIMQVSQRLTPRLNPNNYTYVTATHLCGCASLGVVLGIPQLPAKSHANDQRVEQSFAGNL